MLARVCDRCQAVCKDEGEREATDVDAMIEIAGGFSLTQADLCEGCCTDLAERLKATFDGFMSGRRTRKVKANGADPDADPTAAPSRLFTAPAQGKITEDTARELGLTIPALADGQTASATMGDAVSWFYADADAYHGPYATQEKAIRAHAAVVGDREDAAARRSRGRART